MASTGRRRVNSDRTEVHTYVEGSTARQVHVRRKAEQYRTPETENRRIKNSPAVQNSGRRKTAEREMPGRQQLKRTGVQAKSMGAGYVIFLTAACLVTMFLCVRYLNMKSTLTAQTDRIEALESQLNTLKADNDAYYNQVQASVTLDDIKNAALGYGMHYAAETQIEYYSVDESSYLRQYQELPE